MGGVQHERLSFRQRVIQLARQARVPAFGEACRDVDTFALRRIKINIEMLRTHHLKIERAISDLVAPEVLCRGRRPKCEDQTSDGKMLCALCDFLSADRELHVSRRISTANRRSSGAPSMPRVAVRSLRAVRHSVETAATRLSSFPCLSPIDLGCSKRLETHRFELDAADRPVGQFDSIFHKSLTGHLDS